MVDIEPVREPEADAQEQRQHVRKRVLWAAKLDTKHGSFDCVILNLSRTGAKLRLVTPVVIPPKQTVELVMGAHGTLPGEVIWQRGDKMGLRFSADPEHVAGIVGKALTL